LCFLNNVVTFVLGYFLPIILRNDMSHSVTMSQIPSFSPYVVAVVRMFSTADVADRFCSRSSSSFPTRGGRRRRLHGGVSGECGRMVCGCVLGRVGGDTNMPSFLSYMQNDIEGQMKRSVAIALLIEGGACGDAPQYV
jgi:hypothetical protein